MPDIAALGIKVTETGVVKTTSALDKFAVAAKAAGAAAAKPIAIKVGASGLAEIKAMEKAMAGIRRTRITVDSSSAIAELNKIAAAAERAKSAANFSAKASVSGGPSGGDIGAVTSLKNAVLGLVSAYTLLAGAKAYATLTDESKMLTAQLRLATSETGNFVTAQEDVRRISAAVRTDLDSTATLYGKLMLNSRQLGITQVEAARATETVAKAFKVSGASTAEASQGTRQLVQALQSGVLRGDEFNTMAEAAPRLQKLLADSLGVTQGALRKMAEEGELTSDKLTKAFTDRRFTEGLDKEFAQLPVTFGDAMAQIRNAAVITFGAFDEGGQFSKSLTSFLIGGTTGMADMERAAFQLGQTFRVEIIGMIAGFERLAEVIKMGVNNAISVLSALGPAVQNVQDILNAIGSSTWGSGFVASLKNALAYLNPIVAALKLIRGLGANARASEYAAMQEKSAGGFAGRYLSKFGGSLGGERERIAPIVAETKATKKLTDAQREAKREAEAAKRAYEAKVKAADDYIASLQRENAEFGKSAKEIRLMEVARRMDAAATDKQRAAIKAASDQRENNLGVQEATRLLNIADAKASEIRLIEEETRLQGELGEQRRRALMGLSGDALENELARISDQYEIQVIWLRAQAAAALDAANATHILAKAQAEIAQVRQAQGQDNSERKIEQDRRRALDTAHEIANIIGGSVGNAIGNIADALDKAFPKLAGSLGKDMKGFSELLGKLGAGAKIGSSVDGIFKAIGIKSSNTGAQIGGAIGQFAGPLGAIAGSIIGGIVGGMLKKTPKASATVSIIAGQAMETAITGSSGKLKKMAGQLADGVISGLSGLAEQLGAELTGDAKVSIGMRKKAYVVDTTGAGRTKGAGVENFGEDQAAAIAFALQDAIKDGVLGGLSASLQRLITGDGDLQTQIQKALNFKGVFDELQSKLDPQGFDLAGLDKWRASMDKLFAEAGATADEIAKLEELTGLKRVEIIDKYAKEAQEKERARGELMVRILELEGRSTEALALTRQMERDAADAALRPLYDRIYALEDEASALTALAEIEAVRVADIQTRQGLEIEIMELSGNAAGALAARRQIELLAMGESYRELLLRKYALEDEAAAAAAATEAANAAATLANSRRSLEIEIMELSGNAAGALAATRQLELDAADASLRPLMLRKYALQDEAKITEELAAKQKAIADEMGGLNRQWLEAIGDTQALRDLDLAGLLSDDARALQKKIWAYTDAQEAAAAAAEAAAQAQAAYNEALEAARNSLSQAYEREVGALQATIDKMRGFADAIREFREGLFGAGNPAFGYDQSRAQFQSTSRMANLGDEKALGRFVSDAQAFLEQSRNQATSLVDYQRDVAMVQAAAGRAENGAGGLAGEAERQIKLMESQVAGILGLNEKVTTFAEELANYTSLQAQELPVFVDTVATGLAAVATTVQDTATKSDDRAQTLESTMQAILVAVNRLERTSSQQDAGGAKRVIIDGVSADVVLKTDEVA